MQQMRKGIEISASCMWTAWIREELQASKRQVSSIVGQRTQLAELPNSSRMTRKI